MTVTKKMFAWNLAGCMVNAGASFCMLALVTRNTGLTETGYFSIALACAQLLLTFGRYGVRAYHATDTRHEISSGAYLMHRGIVTAGMLAAAVFVCFLGRYPAYKAAVVWNVCALKAVDAVEDVFHGELQRAGRLDAAGKLLTARNVLTLAVFGILISMGKSLCQSCRLTWILSLAVCLVMNIAAIYKYKIKMAQPDIFGIKRLFLCCFPLFAGQFLSLLIYNMPKYAVDAMESSGMQAVYSMIFMPAFVINLVSEFVFKPLLTPLSVSWETGQVTQVKKMIWKLYAVVLAVSSITWIGGYLTGTTLLGYFYGIKLSAYRMELMVLLLGGGFSAGVYLSYNLLTMLRKTGSVFAGYILGTACMAASVWEMVRLGGILGAAAAYLSAEIVMFLFFCGCLNRAVHQKEQKLL